jgi:predicted metal-dependent phosphoesterase TrpH
VIPPAYPIDLHAHSNRSDGVDEPAALVARAAARGVRIIALADHDTLAGCAEAMAAGERESVRVIPATELNTESVWGDVHVLGYFLDPADSGLEERLSGLRAERERRIALMVERLNTLGYAVGLERVMEIAAAGRATHGTDPLAVGRPHLAEALVEAGHVRSVEDAFATIISKDSPAYVSRVGLSPLEAVRLVVAHGGVAALAHPATVVGLWALLPDLVDAGLVGLEVYYPSHSPAFIRELRTLADTYGLVPTAGSDYHGRGGLNGPLGCAYPPPSCVAALEARRSREGSALDTAGGVP